MTQGTGPSSLGAQGEAIYDAVVEANRELEATIRDGLRALENARAQDAARSGSEERMLVMLRLMTAQLDRMEAMLHELALDLRAGRHAPPGLGNPPWAPRPPIPYGPVTSGPSLQQQSARGDAPIPLQQQYDPHGPLHVDADGILRDARSPYPEGDLRNAGGATMDTDFYEASAVLDNAGATPFHARPVLPRTGAVG